VIARLTGQLIEKQPPTLVVDVNGVGYELEAPMSTFYKVTLGARSRCMCIRSCVKMPTCSTALPAAKNVTCAAHCSSECVGPKMALAILSGMEADAFAACIRQGDVTTLTRIPGVGKKTAETTGD